MVSIGIFFKTVWQKTSERIVKNVLTIEVKDLGTNFIHSSWKRDRPMILIKIAYIVLLEMFFRKKNLVYLVIE